MTNRNRNSEGDPKFAKRDKEMQQYEALTTSTQESTPQLSYLSCCSLSLTARHWVTPPSFLLFTASHRVILHSLLLPKKLQLHGPSGSTFSLPPSLRHVTPEQATKMKKRLSSNGNNTKEACFRMNTNQQYYIAWQGPRGSLWCGHTDWTSGEKHHEQRYDSIQKLQKKITHTSNFTRKHTIKF